MKFFNNLNTQIFLSKFLPLTCMSIEHLSLVYVLGSDAKKYLNQQFSIEIDHITLKNYKIGAHCNYNGKVWGVLIIMLFRLGYLYLIPTDIVKKQILELKKYSVFSKIKIYILSNFNLFGISGKNSENFLSKIFMKNFFIKKNIEYIKNYIFLKICIPIFRVLILVPKTLTFKFLKKIPIDIQKNNYIQWLSLDMESNFPIITQKNMGKFLPQLLNLKFWNAINFKKGCYYGQEMIFKIETKKIFNTHLICIKGISNFLPKIGDSIYCFRNNIFYSVGKIFYAIFINTKKIFLQVSLKNQYIHYNTFFLTANTTFLLKIFKYNL
ncbi:hypothetical protein [Buchnera aphidicola]|uniref:CAF17-like 4Fe-4S cluster assembly/insertion protein YgfZ n=1 Tax=Buchnera aphidicola TaxID=9 RepID=UPI00313AD6BB